MCQEFIFCSLGFIGHGWGYLRTSMWALKVVSSYVPADIKGWGRECRWMFVTELNGSSLKSDRYIDLSCCYPTQEFVPVLPENSSREG